MLWIWGGFLALVVGLLALDLGVFHRNPHAVSAKEALGWTAFWIALSLVFNGGIYFLYEHHLFGIGEHIGHDVGGKEAALAYFTGYIIEKSLSLDNIFIIALIISYFHIPLKYQHRLLFWGVLGAIAMRGAMIAAGVSMIERFEWTIYLFGAILIGTAIKMLFSKNEEVHPERNPLVLLMRKFYPVTTKFDGPHFFVVEDGVRKLTPMALAIVVIESADLLFAVDSVPAVIAVTHDPFLVFTSNVFAILGLRSLYFALAAIMGKFHYLKASLVLMLLFIGVKMLLANTYHIPIGLSLGVISLILGAGIVASLIWSKQHPEADEHEEDADAHSK